MRICIHSEWPQTHISKYQFLTVCVLAVIGLCMHKQTCNKPFGWLCVVFSCHQPLNVPHFHIWLITCYSKYVLYNTVRSYWFQTGNYNLIIKSLFNNVQKETTLLRRTSVKDRSDTWRYLWAHHLHNKKMDESLSLGMVWCRAGKKIFLELIFPWLY